MGNSKDKVCLENSCWRFKSWSSFPPETVRKLCFSCLGEKIANNSFSTVDKKKKSYDQKWAKPQLYSQNWLKFLLLCQFDMWWMSRRQKIQNEAGNKSLNKCIWLQQKCPQTQNDGIILCVQCQKKKHKLNVKQQIERGNIWIAEWE